MDETIVSSRKIFKGRIVRLEVHEVRLSDGHLSKREMVHHPGAVAVVALDDEQNVLLVRQFRLGAGKVLYEIPAGTLNAGETPEVCAARELQEEAGYKPGKLEALGGYYTAPGYTTEIIHIYLATDLSESRLQGDADEIIEVERVPLSRALAMIEEGDISDGKTLVGLLQVARRLGV